ncbi:hypothetical protein K438DRAFT_1886832 [Mycena galopus ATCC 62051]|nr:hypothetical protein K438DRAFT_1886832 [Mycena galopus ATCC 62051]
MFTILTINFFPPALFSTTYGFNMGTSGLTYLGLGIGFVLATAISNNTHIIFLVGETHCGKGEPEMGIPALIFGSLFVPVGLLWVHKSQFPAVLDISIAGTAGRLRRRSIE